MKRVYHVVFAIYYALCIGAMVVNLSKGYTQAFLMGFASIGLSFLVPLIFKLFKWKPIYEIYIEALFFFAMASLFGSTYRFYTIVPYWDKITHLCSGILGLQIGYCLFNGLKKQASTKKEDLPLMFVFIYAVNIAIAALWEQYEYLCLVVADYDAIRHYSTGVHDSMTDITSAIVGGLIATIFIVMRYKQKKGNFFTNVYEKFYTLNIEGKK